MSINTIKTFAQTKLHTISIVVDPESMAAFQELVHRGANLWPDAPPEIKEFADIVTNGYAMQDYYSLCKSSNK
jgi:hypothetical protein